MTSLVGKGRAEDTINVMAAELPVRCPHGMESGWAEMVTRGGSARVTPSHLSGFRNVPGGTWGLPSTLQT